MTKIEGSGSIVRGMDPRIQIRIHTKMTWIRNTGLNAMGVTRNRLLTTSGPDPWHLITDPHFWQTDPALFVSDLEKKLHPSELRCTPLPEIIDPVFAKTSQNARFLLSENERFGLVFVKTGYINSGTCELRSTPLSQGATTLHPPELRCTVLNYAAVI